MSARAVARVMVLAAERGAALAAERAYFDACERAARSVEMPRGRDDAALDAYSRARTAAREAAGLSNEVLRDLRQQRLACEQELVAAMRRTFPTVVRGLSHTQVIDAAVSAARAVA